MLDMFSCERVKLDMCLYVTVKMFDMCPCVTAAHGNEDSSSINEQPLRVLPALLHARLRGHYSTRWVETMSNHIHVKTTSKGLCKEFFPQKSEITMEVGGWVGPALTRIFVVENRPKIALNQY